MTRKHSLTGKEIITCVICSGDIEHKIDHTTGKVYWTEGHNAQPVKDGRCCDTCNATAVMTARLASMFGEKAPAIANTLASIPKPSLEQAEKDAEEAQRSREYGYVHPTVDDYDESLDDPNYEEPEGDE